MHFWHQYRVFARLRTACLLLRVVSAVAMLCLIAVDFVLILMSKASFLRTLLDRVSTGGEGGFASSALG